MLGGSSILLGMPPKMRHQVPPTLSSKLSSKGFTALTHLFLSPLGNPHRSGLTCRLWSGFQRCQEKQERGNRQELHHGSVRLRGSRAVGTCCGEKMPCNQC